MSYQPGNNLKVVRHAFSEKLSPGIRCSQPGRTKQSFKAECDIHNILAKFRKTGLIDFVNKNEARYGDFSDFDFRSAMDTIAAANSMFEQLPSDIRSQFKNDPTAFIAFMDDPDNDLKAIKVGLKRPSEPPEEVQAAFPPEPQPVADKPVKGASAPQPAS